MIISGTRSAPLTSSHGSAEDAVDEIEDAQRTLCKQPLDLTDVLDTVHVSSPFCRDTIFYHIRGRKDCRMMQEGKRALKAKKAGALRLLLFCYSISYFSF